MKSGTPFATVAIAAALSLHSCSHRQYPTTATETVQTTTIVETLHDTVVTLAPDSAMLQALIECDSTGQAYLKEIEQLRVGAKLHQTLSLQNNLLTAAAHIDSMEIYLTYKDRYRHTDRRS